MSNENAIKAVLEADATLLTTATGGVWSWSDTGRLGLDRKLTPDAFDTTTGLIKPCLLVKSRSQVPDGGVYELSTPELSVAETVEVWFYENFGYSSIDTMRDRVFVLLHEQQLDSIFVIRWAGNPILSGIDDAMGNVSVERSDFTVLSLKQ